MYPFVRLIKAQFLARRQAPLGLFECHHSHHICWPWDLDPWFELNNGRTLTLYDLGRIPLAIRVGFATGIRGKGWGMAVAGSAVRYRRRVRAFDRVRIETRCLGWDSRFLYFDQSMWKGQECASQVLLRSAITSASGIVAPQVAMAAIGLPSASPELPLWVRAWIEAENQRPWPPSR